MDKALDFFFAAGKNAPYICTAKLDEERDDEDHRIVTYAKRKQHKRKQLR